MLKNDDLKYEKIERYVDELIKNGGLNEGNRLLSEKALGKMFNASTITVRKGMQKFIDNGTLVKIHGKGTFVNRVGKRTATNTFGVLFWHSQEGFLASPFYTAILGGIELETNRFRKRIILSRLVRDENDHPAHVLDELKDDVDGYLVVDMLPQVADEVLTVLKRQAKPAVILNYEGINDEIDAVVFDGRANIKKMTDLLFQLGHRRMVAAYATARWLPEQHPNYKNRIMGFREGLEDHGLPFTKESTVVINSGEQPEDVAALERLFKSAQRPTAVVGLDDVAAMRVCQIAQALGLAVPRDLTVTGHDNLKDAKNAQPPLTTFHTPLIEMGSMGVKRLMEKLDEQERGTSSCHRIVLPGSLIERGSHCPPRSTV